MDFFRSTVWQYDIANPCLSLTSLYSTNCNQSIENFFFQLGFAVENQDTHEHILNQMHKAPGKCTWLCFPIGFLLDYVYSRIVQEFCQTLNVRVPTSNAILSQLEHIAKRRWRFFVTKWRSGPYHLKTWVGVCGFRAGFSSPCQAIQTTSRIISSSPSVSTSCGLCFCRHVGHLTGPRVDSWTSPTLSERPAWLFHHANKHSYVLAGRQIPPKNLSRDGCFRK